MMTELNSFLESLNKDNKKDVRDIIAFLQDNGWFGTKPVFENGKYMLSDKQNLLYTQKITDFLNGSRTDIYNKLQELYPETSKKLRQFADEEETDDDFLSYIADFLLYRLKKDIFLYSDDEIQGLLKKASYDLIKAHGEYLTFFLAWLRLKMRTCYFRDYTMEKRYVMDTTNGAYEFDEYIELLYKLLCDEYIESNDMFKYAAESMNYTDTWLFLAIHFICSLRITDLERIYHPTLTTTPENTLKMIKEGTFSDNDARLVLLSITQRLAVLPLKPNKTDIYSNTDYIKFHIPDSCEALFGKLFALAEAHRQINNLEDMPIIRKISTYREISRYMGEDIGEIFLEADFRSKSATKSYLQLIYMVAEQMPGDNAALNTKGYILASRARSHKGGYGKFAKTTFEYLKDAQLSGLTHEFVAYELLERGVLSFMASALLNMITKEEFSKYPVKKQTMAIQELDLSPHEIETIITTLDTSKKQAMKVVKEVMSSGVDVLSVLHRIGNGEAVSKESGCLCLITALGKICPYDTKKQCVGCKYEISTKSTFYLLISEYNRLKSLYEESKDDLERKKYKKIIVNTVIPKLDEMLYCLRENYGEECFSQYEQLIKEYVC